jgi:hypothetical protein
MIITPKNNKNPPILILHVKNGLLLLTIPVALNIINKPITVSAKPTAEKKPGIINIQSIKFFDPYLRLIISAHAILVVWAI